VAKPGEIPEWKQPTEAQDAYTKGDKVRHNGKIWISNVDANVLGTRRLRMGRNMTPAPEPEPEEY
jgi:hypothetical protein